ncbi:MAG TPA: purine-binding chemotaxis protein CheW [Firmicutes bacterium]|nr:purine-binding chemotaxis protein CheW [Bacillota bacterium]
MESVQLVVFHLNGAEYAVTIDQVQEIINVTEITRVPRAPQFILGVFNLRGKILPAIDLKQRLGLGTTVVGEASRLVVVKVGEHTVGLLVDGVSETTAVDRQEIEPASVMMGGVAQELVEGIVKLGERLITWLDLDRLLAQGGEEASEPERQVG